MVAVWTAVDLDDGRQEVRTVVACQGTGSHCLCFHCCSGQLSGDRVILRTMTMKQKMVAKNCPVMKAMRKRWASALAVE